MTFTNGPTADSALLSLSSILAKDLVGKAVLPGAAEDTLTRLGKTLSGVVMLFFAAVALSPRITLWGLLEWDSRSSRSERKGENAKWNRAVMTLRSGAAGGATLRATHRSEALPRHLLGDSSGWQRLDMSKDRGTTLPADLLSFLSSSEPSGKFQQVILFTTTDDDGWPRHGMLSPFEVVAKDSKRLLMLLYEASRSSENLRREGRVSLVLINPEMSYYVRCSAQPLPPLQEAPKEALFDLEVEQVLEDSLATARIRSGIIFEGYDPGMSQEDRQLVFQELLAM